jgi:hypothetical protein
LVFLILRSEFFEAGCFIMTIQAVRDGIQHAWKASEPYHMPAVIASGVCVIVAQVWGATMAACFTVGVVGFACAFPQVVTQLTSDDVLLPMARLVLMAVLPFFGPLGIASSVAIAAVSMGSQDLQLFRLRAKQAANQAMISDIKSKSQDLLDARCALIKECNEANASNLAHWNERQPAQAVLTALDRVEKMIREGKADMENTLSSLTQEEALEKARGIAAEFAELRAFVDRLAAQYDTFIKQGC